MEGVSVLTYQASVPLRICSEHGSAQVRQRKLQGANIPTPTSAASTRCEVGRCTGVNCLLRVYISFLHYGGGQQRNTVV